MIFRHASVSKTYPGQFVGQYVGAKINFFFVGGWGRGEGRVGITLYEALNKFKDFKLGLFENSLWTFNCFS